ncbi:MAG: signal recognition particle subunit SRP54 [bacterium]|jgi:signal recognition particle subunit SRP54
MFENLSEKFTNAFRKITNKGILTEANITSSLKEVKMALLEADVNYRVVNAFLKSVKTRALGSEVMKSLSPAQQLIKIVNDELANMMGKENHGIQLVNNKVTIIMMVGLQGSGKTTTTAKLANRLKKEGKSVYLVPADIYRPAAIDQLQALAKSIDIPCFDSTKDMKVVDIVTQAYQIAEERNSTVMIIDTAGRLHIDEKLMNELEDIKKAVPLAETLLVIDAMTGQDAVQVAKAFNDKLSVTGFVLTKMDGDARGGAALSIRSITGMPVKFVGVGEKVDNLDPFYPDRIASKILGMGDMMSLIEKAEEHFDESDAVALEEKIRKNSFTLADFQDQLRQIQKMGSLTDLMGMLPGVNSKMMQGQQVDDGALIKVDAIISSMTKKERGNHTLINGTRKTRIAKGSGTQVSDVNKLIKQFIQMRKMMKKFSSMGSGKKSMRSLKNMLGPGSPF